MGRERGAAPVARDADHGQAQSLLFLRNATGMDVDIAHDVPIRSVIEQAVDTSCCEVPGSDGGTEVANALGTSIVDVERGAAGRIRGRKLDRDFRARGQHETRESHRLGRRACGCRARAIMMDIGATVELHAVDGALGGQRRNLAVRAPCAAACSGKRAAYAGRDVGGTVKGFSVSRSQIHEDSTSIRQLCGRTRIAAHGCLERMDMVFPRVFCRRADSSRRGRSLGRGGRGGVRRIRIDVTHQLIARTVIHEPVCAVGRQIACRNGRIAVLDGLSTRIVDVERRAAGGVRDSETDSHLSARGQRKTRDRHDLGRRTCGRGTCPVIQGEDIPPEQGACPVVGEQAADDSGKRHG